MQRIPGTDMNFFNGRVFWSYFFVVFKINIFLLNLLPSFSYINLLFNHMKNSLSSTLNSPTSYYLIHDSYKLGIWILPNRIVQTFRVILWQILPGSSILYNHYFCFLCGHHPLYFFVTALHLYTFLLPYRQLLPPSNAADYLPLYFTKKRHNRASVQ